MRTAGIESGSLHIPKLDAAFIDRGAYLPSGACFKSLSSFEETYRLRAYSESVALLHASSLLRLGHNLRIALVTDVILKKKISSDAWFKIKLQ